MKKVAVLIILLTLAALAFAQSPIAKGEKQVNAGIGLSSWGLPVYVGIDYGIHPDISVGGEISYRSWEYGSYNHSIIGLLVNGNYHLNKLMELPPEFDFYAGLNLGFYIWISPEEYGGSKSSGLGLGGQVGGRYYFTDKLAANLELGGGTALSGGKLGLSYKL